MWRFEQQALGEIQPDDRRDAAPVVTAARKPRPLGVVARLLAALHHSRRLQAQNVLEAHRHLRAGSAESGQSSATRDTLSIAERASPAKRSIAISNFAFPKFAIPNFAIPKFAILKTSESLLLAIIPFAFLIFHIVIGTSVQRALPGDPAAQQKAAIVSYGD